MSECSNGEQILDLSLVTLPRLHVVRDSSCCWIAYLEDSLTGPTFLPYNIAIRMYDEIYIFIHDYVMWHMPEFANFIITKILLLNRSFNIIHKLFLTNYTHCIAISHCWKLRTQLHIEYQCFTYLGFSIRY